MTDFFFRRPIRRRWVWLLLLGALLLAGTSPDAAAQVHVHIGSGTALDGGNARLAVSGDWANEGTFTPNTGTVVFDGSSTQVVTGTNAFYGLGVDNSAATGGLSLGSATTVQARLELLNGSLDNSSTTVTLGDGATIRRATGTLAAAPTFAATVNVEYTGTADVATGNELPDPAGPTSVETLTLTGSGRVSLTKPVTVTRALTLRGGSLDNSTSEVTVASGAEVQPGGGTLDQTPTYAGPVELTYNGSGPLTTGTELPDVVDRITVSAPGGLTLAKDVTVTDRLVISEGTMDLGGFDVTLDGSAVLDEQPGAVVSGAAGQIQATRTLTAPSGVDVAGLGFTITSAADLGSTTVVRTHARPFNDADVAVARVYDVTPAQDGGLNATISVRYDDSERLFPDVEDPLELYRSTDGGATWTLIGGTVDPAANTVTLAGVDALSQWTVGAPADVLPVELAAFRADVQGDRALLTWTTTSETDNAGFDVERRSGAGTWIRLGRIAGAGTTTEAQTYRFHDTALPYAADSLTYRLRQTDLNGTSTLSDAITVARTAVETLELLATFPNPARSRTTVRFALPRGADRDATLQLYDLLGRRVRQVSLAGKAGRNEQHVSVSGLASGLYFLRLTAGGETRTQRLSVVR
jgi:hypothetical protein